MKYDAIQIKQRPMGRGGRRAHFLGGLLDQMDVPKFQLLSSICQ